MKNFEKIEELGITSKEKVEGVKKDYKEMKEKADRLECFLCQLTKAFQSEYNFG